MTIKRTLFTAAALLVAMSAFAAVDRDQPERVRAGAGRPVRELGLVRIPIEISVPNAILGGYVARITFDPAVLTFVSAAGGASPEFKADPAYTFTQKANETGVVRIAAAQTNQYGPTGKVSVAMVTFRELVAGGANSIKVTIESAASALPRDGHPTTLVLPVDTQ